VATTQNVQEPGEGSGKLYYSISEVAELVDVKPHVLRYWETQFKMLRPRKNRAGNRSYRVKDVKMALRIKKLLKDERFTIAGARRKLLDEQRSGISQTEMDFVGISREDFVRMLRRDLTELLAVLQGERSIESLGQHRDDDEPPQPKRGVFAEMEMSDEPDGGPAEGEADDALDEEARPAATSRARSKPDGGKTRRKVQAAAARGRAGSTD
jgi:DNA-binding transcriptional MerR regulator